GSIQNGNSRPDSDIDLGIMLEPGRKMSSLRRIELANKLSYELGRTVDMGEVSSRNLVYTREALLKGHLLFQKDFNKTNLYRANLLGLYIQFNLDRQEVINAYRA
ncbi:MAG: nucleotidyltransferase domain-containing protein, partial [Spirochaetales bacterium]|nr:nucleotidyltransferase domain-containing protein [Spirochaetales bacterium]